MIAYLMWNFNNLLSRKNEREILMIYDLNHRDIPNNMETLLPNCLDSLLEQYN